nr:alcohol dehydrogenase catalytic domain-containing protein [Actinomyces ruminis]
MRASVLRERGVVVLEERPVPSPDPDQVLVRIESVGVCGSDVHYYQHGRIGDFVVNAPMILGHESAGTIVAVGDDVDPARVASAFPSSRSAAAVCASTASAGSTTCVRTSSSTPPRPSTAASPSTP